MKILILTAIIAAVSTTQLSVDQPESQSPWQVGKLYRYDVHSKTLARLQEGASSGNAFRAHFIVRVRAPNKLHAKLENPEHAQLQQQLPNRELPSDLKYQPVPNLEKPFEIVLDGGRVVSLSFPTALSLPHENLLKGLIGALQVDLSTHRNIHGSHDNYDKESHQGLFRKMEIDVTGDCETLYAVSPVAAEWRRELPNFAQEEDPILITKSKNYGHCHQRVAYHFGVPEGAEWTGTAHRPEEDQFIRRATVSRILASKNGHIYKAETTSTVHVHPHLYGKQKAEVHSDVLLKLVALEQDTEGEWQKPEGNRLIKSLLYSMSTKQVAYHDKSSSSSSSSESSSHEHMPIQDPKHRVRRFAKAPKVVPVNKDIVKHSESSSSSSSSSSDSSSAYVNDEIPSINEPAYAALYMSPQTHTDKKQNVMNVQKLLQDIAQQLQNPNNMPKADFLSKFNILVRVIAAMSTEQLGQTSRSIEVAKSSNNLVKSDMWMIYRDAVVQAGTLPAFQQIKTWIQTKKIQGEEAAEVVATLVNTLRYPTKEVMSQFFKLAVSAEVSQQRFLNTSALIAATRFINMGQVNNVTAHSYYPTHMYGRLARKHDTFVLDEILPHLSEELKNAILLGDSGKAQVYIRAIGNLGHREILRVFAPYLEGKIPTSTYLRVQMVNSLQVLTQEWDRHVRNVLFSILRNTAEHYEVRVAAITRIFMTGPSTTMVYTMAQMTHDDPSIQVRAALKSGILSAAQLRSPRHIELSRTASSAKWMLTKENFGYQYSIKNLYDIHDFEHDMDVFSSISHIGSEDSIFPKSMWYTLRTRKTGLNSHKFYASVSSVAQFVEYLKEAVQEPQSMSQTKHKYSAQKVAQMLNFKRDPEQPLEASIYLDIINQQRLFTFSEDDLKHLPEDIRQYMTEVAQGVDKHYTKVLNQAQVSIMFPLAMGMPFIFKYKEPTVIHIQSKAKGEINFNTQENGFQATMDKEIQLTFARNIDGSVGFMDTLMNQYSSVGVVNKIQLNLPVKMNIQLEPRGLKLRMEPLNPDMDTTLIHYSVWPYSASQKKDSLVTISQDPTTKVIERSRKVYSADYKFGQKIGMIFHLQGYSYSHDFQTVQKMFPSNDILSNILYVFGQQDVAMTHFNFRHLGKQSQNKAVTFHVVYDKLQNQKHSGEINEATDMQDVTPNSEARRQEVVKRAATGINTARVQVIDLSAIFEGPQKVEYILTAALGESPVDRKIQYALFAGINASQGKASHQVNAVGKIVRPEITTLNFLQALEKELKASIMTDIKFGQASRIQIQAKAQRSEQYTEELKAMPRTKQCTEEIAQNNFYQYACHKMIIMAHAPDSLEATINYKNIDQQFKNMTYHFYTAVRNLGFWNSDVNPMKNNPEGKVDIKANARYSQNILDWSMTSKYGHIEMNNVPLPRWSAGALAFYEPFKFYDRVQNYYTGHQFQPFCTVDGSRVRTFSNRSYDYTLSPSWHVVLQDQAKEHTNWQDLVILSRRPSPDQQHVYISYKTEDGKDLEIEITPAFESSPKHNVQVKTNGKKVSEGDLTMYWNDVSNKHLLKYYTHADGVLVLSIDRSRIRVLYDGKTLVVLSNVHRNTARGICGHMSGDPRDDFETPNGLVDRPELYAASFALNDETSDPKTLELQNLAKQQAYQPNIKYTTILRSDIEWENNMHSSSEEKWKGEIIYRSRSYLKRREVCQLQQQVQYYENHGEICITTTRLPACQSHCRGEGYKVMPVQVVCRPKLDQQYQVLRNQIQQGQNPQVSGVPLLKNYKVPAVCSA